METQIRKTEKGFVAQLAWSDGTKINSRAFPTSVEAQDWLLEQVLAQKGHIYRDKPVQKTLAALAALATPLNSSRYRPCRDAVYRDRRHD